MRNVSWIFAPVAVKKHSVVAALEPGKNILSSPMKDTDSPREISLLERLLCKRRMLGTRLDRVHATFRSRGGSHHCSSVPVATANLQDSSRMSQCRDYRPQRRLQRVARVHLAIPPVLPPMLIRQPVQVKMRISATTVNFHEQLGNALLHDLIPGYLLLYGPVRVA